jgi:DNA polymerase III alpha subunit (gram-positive type)
MQTLLIDFETTGVDTTKDRIIEIGAQLVDEKWDIIGQVSCLVKGEDYPPLTHDITRITKITQDVLDKEGLAPAEAFKLLGDMAGPDLNYAIAFNRNFDENIFKAEMARQAFGLMPGINNLIQIPWLCAMVDIETNYQFKSWKLAHLALEYDVAVNPKELHRAINDVELMRKMLAASGATAQAMYAFQQTPWTFIRAIIPAPWEDGGKGKAEAQKLGYSWETAKGTDGPKFEKAWIKRVKATHVENEIKQATFKVREIRS